MDPTPTPVTGRLRLAVGMALRTRPYAVVASAAVVLAAGAAPVLVAWLPRRVIDAIPGAGGVGAGFVVTTAVALALTGLALALLPHLARYLQAELDRAVGPYARAGAAPPPHRPGVPGLRSTR